VLVVVLLVVSGIRRYAGHHKTALPAHDELTLAVDPPEPYFD